MAIGLFDLEDPEQGILSHNFLFAPITPRGYSHTGKHAPCSRQQTPDAVSRQQTPDHLSVVVPIHEEQEEPASCDEHAWFIDEVMDAGSDLLNNLASPPLSTSSVPSFLLFSDDSASSVSPSSDSDIIPVTMAAKGKRHLEIDLEEIALAAKRSRNSKSSQGNKHSSTLVDANGCYGFTPYSVPFTTTGWCHMAGYGAPYQYGAPQWYGPPQMPDMLSRTSSTAFSRTSSSSSSRRGENIKCNPQMQKQARDGQKHWHEKVQQLRAEAAGTSAVCPQYQEQRLMCRARNLKSQKESLLIFLQLSTQKGLISPLSFVHAGDESAGFVGWTGFLVNSGCGEQFRAGVEGLFPEKPKLNTLYHLFRRSGLVPEDWRRAWDGRTPFLFQGNPGSK